MSIECNNSESHIKKKECVGYYGRPLIVKNGNMIEE